MRVFFDSNVLLAAFLSDGACRALFRKVIEGEIVGVVSDRVVEEVARNLRTVSGIAPSIRGLATERIRQYYSEVPTPKTFPARCRDANDDPIIAAASASAEVLVTGDKDILVLGREGAGIEVLRPADLLRRLG